MESAAPPVPTRAHAGATLASIWRIVEVIRALLILSGAFAFACSVYSMFFRVGDDRVVVGAIFFGVFTICVAGVAIVAALHRVCIVLDEAIKVMR
jgi:hypothetical protein